MTKRPSDEQDKKVSSDERNIVSLDSDYEGASFEDRIFLFWHHYRRAIVATVVVAVVVLLGWGAIVLWQDYSEGQVRAAYRDAVTMDEKRAFAQRYASHRLGGIAYLEIGDYHFNNQEYSEAIDNYRQAARSLDGTPLAPRARIGEGISLGLSEREEEALQVLERVADDPAVYPVLRAEAYYQAALIAAELGEIDRAWDLAGNVLEHDPTMVWSRKAFELRATLPQADEEDIVPGMPMMQAPPSGPAQPPIELTVEPEPVEETSEEEEPVTPEPEEDETAAEPQP